MPYINHPFARLPRFPWNYFSCVWIPENSVTPHISFIKRFQHLDFCFSSYL